MDWSAVTQLDERNYALVFMAMMMLLIAQDIGAPVVELARAA